MLGPGVAFKMSLWDWLFGGRKNSDFEGAARLPFAPLPPRAPPPAAPAPVMQQIQLTAPAAVPTSYGIQRAIELMRALPVDDDPSLVLRVVRKTLRSTGVSLEEIVATAQDRENAIVRGIESDRAAIEQLEIQITTRRGNITRLEGDLEETREVRGRIEEALASETKVGNSLPPEEILRIRAEAAAKSQAPPLPKADAPKGDASKPELPKPEMPKPLAPPIPKAPVLGSKPPPKLPSALSPPIAKRDVTPIVSKDTKAGDAKASDAKDAKPKDADDTRETKPNFGPDTKPPVTPDAKVSSALEVGARSGPMTSIPDLGEIDDGFDEPTATREIEVPPGGKPSE
jgi:hypothetical protein